MGKRSGEEEVIFLFASLLKGKTAEHSDGKFQTNYWRYKKTIFDK